jgi:hypothetical protein
MNKAIHPMKKMKKAIHPMKKMKKVIHPMKKMRSSTGLTFSSKDSVLKIWSQRLT